MEKIFFLIEASSIVLSESAERKRPSEVLLADLCDKFGHGVTDAP